MLKHTDQFLTIFRKILFWSIVFLLAFILLYPKFPLANVSGTFVAVRLEDFFILIVVVLWGVYLLLSKQFIGLLHHKLFQVFILFFLVTAVSLFSGIFLTQTVVPNLGILHFARRFEFMVLLLVAYTVIESKKEIKIILGVLGLIILVVNIYAFGQQYLHWPVISTTNSEFSKGQILYLSEGARVSSTFAGHYDLAVFLMMVIIILSSIFFSIKNLIYKVIIMGMGAMSFVVLIMTAARVSFIAVIIGVLTGLLIAGKRKFILFLFILTVIALVYPSQLQNRFISTITINLQNQGERYTGKSEEQLKRSELNIPTLATTKYSESMEFLSPEEASKTASDITPGEPLDTTQLGVYRSFAIRLNYEWPGALRAFYKNPFLGTGYSSLGIAADNDFLRALGETGLLGTWALSLIFLVILIQVWRNIKIEDEFLKYFSIGIFAMIIGFLVNGLFIDVLEASKVAALFWLLVGVNFAIAKFRNDS